MKKFALPFVLILIVAAIVKAYVHYRADQQVHELLANISPYVDFQYIDLDVELNGEIILQDVSIHDLKGNLLLELEEILIHNYDYISGESSQLDIELKQVKFKVKKMAYKNPINLYALGYREIKSDIRLAYRYNEFANVLTVNLGAKVIDVANMVLNVELANIDKEQWRYYLRDPGSILLVHAELSYQEISLVKNIIKQIAKMNNQSTEDVLQDITAKMQFYQQQFKSQTADSNAQWRQALLTKWVTFLKNPQQFRFKSHVEQGISFRTVRGLQPKDNIAKRLGLSFEI